MPIFEVIRTLRLDGKHGGFYGPVPQGSSVKSLGTEIELEDEEVIAALMEAGAIQEPTYGADEVNSLKSQIEDLKARLGETERKGQIKRLQHRVKTGPNKVVTIQQLKRRRAS